MQAQMDVVKTKNDLDMQYETLVLQVPGFTNTSGAMPPAIVVIGQDMAQVSEAFQQIMQIAVSDLGYDNNVPYMSDNASEKYPQDTMIWLLSENDGSGTVMQAIEAMNYLHPFLTQEQRTKIEEVTATALY